MIQSESSRAAAGSSDVFSFRASNVTGTRELPLEVDRRATVRDITRSIADLMALPEDVGWSLRADRGQFLEEDLAIGDQLAPESHVTITPRTHLG